MANANKVVLNRPDGEEVLVDLTGDSVTPETLGKGVTAHDKTGAPIVGTMESGGGAPVEEKDVNFYDYDGTLLYSYTIEEAQALTELPQLPDRSNEGLTCQRWNWTVDDIHGIESESIGADIGAVYTTTDGKTHFHVGIEKDGLEVTLNFTGTVTVEWGDGNTSSSVTSPTKHTFASKGKYVIKMSSTGSYAIGSGVDGEYAVTPANIVDKVHLVTNGNNYCLANTHMKYLSIAHNKEIKSDALSVSPKLRFLVLSHKYCIGLNGAFQASSLEIVSTPKDFCCQNQVFRGCYALRRIAFSKPTTMTENYKFYQTYGLDTMYIPGTKIGAYDYFQSGLRVAIISSGIKSIGANAFDSCFSLVKIKFYPTTPPTVENTAAFNRVPTTCVVEVPKGTLATYQAATNYSGIAAQMVEAES